MRPRATVLITLICAVLASTSGCSKPPAGNPAPTPHTSAAGGLPTDGAPNVNDPLTNTAAVESDPCSAITTSQVESLGGKVKSVATDELSLGRGCAWVFADLAGDANAGLVTGNKNGLSSIYAQNARGGLTSFAPVAAVAGYPAVTYENGGEEKGSCTLAVGVRNDLVYTVITQLNDNNTSYGDPCGMATKMAQFGIQRMKGA
jgi:hypothetical protein